MKTKESDSTVKTIAAVTLDTIQEFMSRGRGLSVDELAEAIGASPRLAGVFDHTNGVEKFNRNEVLRLTREVTTLKEQFEKADGHRRRLLTQPDEAEAASGRSMDFLKRVLPTLIQLVEAEGDIRFSDNLDRIKVLVKKAAPLDQLESAFQELKDAAFRTEVKQPEKKGLKLPSLFALFKRSSAGPEFGEYFKETYLDIIHELRLILDQAALSELTALEERLRNSQGMEDYLSIRGDLLLLLKEYISRMGTERTEAAGFIREIGQRLLEVEQHILNTVASSRESENAGNRLAESVEKGMAAFKEAVDHTHSLEDMKSQVVASILTIQEALEAHRKDESVRRKLVVEVVGGLKKSLGRMREEVKSAKQRSEILEAALLTDPLTRAHNRRAYEQRLDEEFSRFRRYQSVFSMLLLDVDHFKAINDRFGHSVGDLCLREIINRIKPLLRDTDILARFGGEEFVILLPGTLLPGAEKAAEKIRVLIEKTEFLHKGEPVRITISLGVTEVHEADASGQVMFDRADQALYKAKESGRNRVVAF